MCMLLAHGWPHQRPCALPSTTLRNACGRCSAQPCRARAHAVAFSSAHPPAGNYSMAVAEALDSPLSYVALMVVPIGIYFMFKILLWDYTSRRTDDPNDPGRQQSFSLSARPGPGIMAEPNPVPPVRHSIRDPNLQAMATAAADNVANAVRHAKSEYESELKLREMNNDHVGALEWDWVCSKLQTQGLLSTEILARARQQVQQSGAVSTSMAVSTVLAELVAEQQALKEAAHICQTLNQVKA